MDVGDVKATIRDGNRAADNGQQILKRAAAEAAAAEQLARHTIHDSQDRDAQAGLDTLTDIAEEVDRTILCFAAAVRRADIYLAKLG